MSTWEDLVCITPAQGFSLSLPLSLSHTLSANKKLLRARQQIIWDVQMFCKRLRCWERKDHGVATEPEMCSQVKNSNRISGWFQALLHAIHGSHVFIITAQYILAQNISSATNYSSYSLNHITSVLVFNWSTMVLHKHVHVLSHCQSVSSCMFGSTCSFMYIWPHPFECTQSV